MMKSSGEMADGLIERNDKGVEGDSFVLTRVIRLWNIVSSGSSSRRILGAALTIGAFTVVVKLVTIVKETIVAACFGTNDVYDAFIVAFLVPMTITSLVSASLNAALIPTYIQIRETEGCDSADQLYTTVLCLNIAMLIVLSLLIGIATPLWLPIIASGFSPSKLSLTETLVYWLLPLVLLSGLSTTWGAILNAGKRFAVVAFASIGRPIAIIGVLLLTGKQSSIFALLAGTLIGAVIETTIVGIALARRGHPLVPRWHRSGRNAMRQVVNQYGSTVAGAVLMSAGTITDQAMAAMLGPRSNSALSYGNKIPSLVMTLSGATLGTALLPELSHLAARKDWEKFKHSIANYAKLTALVSIPVSLLLVILSHPLAAILFERGAFTSKDTQLVAQIQLFYLLRMPIPIISTVFVRAMTALYLNYILSIVAVVQVTLNVSLNYVFMKQLGVPGIALSTLCVSITAFSLIACVLSIHLKRIDQS